ncbi:hypothetical protein SAMN05421767_1355 [Granulicatella balaenopterae]|uniref:DUF7916 domain-containing protein n=1 Tax=Granulicatella balaenopterae TaxID=137733 RepID=A0A1H9N5T0_9LACT|nr:PEP phosphonomutase [Granulicatella balaenopterae]SER31127.1 hypothetical protein SAMN05421767_1355 [Granulicatella balaenopterae]
MIKRLISANVSDIMKMSAIELKQSIKSSAGRVILAENVCSITPQIPDITNSEIAAASGADMILLNVIDLFDPHVSGLTDDESKDFVNVLHKLTGKVIGVNLEPVDESASMLENQLTISKGRHATVETFKRANELGLDFICLTGNPGVGVTNKQILEAIKNAKKHFNGLIIAGKMHGAGVDEKVISEKAIQEFIDAGTDIILVPAVGTVPGVRYEDLNTAVDLAHKQDVLVMSAIGTSQETSDIEVIKRFAIDSKIAGVDIQHIGDAGPGGLANVENIYNLSVAVRGKKHTLSRICRSINR